MSTATAEALHAALATVIDPELRRPITELGMLESVSSDDDGMVHVAVLLTIVFSLFVFSRRLVIDIKVSAILFTSMTITCCNRMILSPK